MTGQTTATTAPRRRRSPWIVAVFGLLGLAILIGLGTWQVKRLHWKEGLLATIHERIHSAPRPLAEIEKRFAETGDVDYWPVEASGRFLNGHERDFLATYDGNSGFYVYAPLQLDDGRYVLVNRGFVPYSRKDPSKWPQGELKGRVTVDGLARNPLAKKPSYFVPDNEPLENIFYWKDLKVMAKTAGLPLDKVLPFFIDAGRKPANPGGLPIGGVTVIDIPNNHFGYALTWYGLAAVLASYLGIFLWNWLFSKPEPDA